MKKGQITSIIIGILILIGLFSGFSYWLGQKSIKLEKEITVPDFLTSKVIQKWSAVASGKVIEISGRTLTLRKSEDILIIPISETARIYLFNPEGIEMEEKLQEIQFGEIGVGDEVNIQIVIKEGNIEGDTVTILSPE